MTEKRWYVVAYHDRQDDPNALVWTVSRTPDETGWETDCGHPGYGLTKADAEELADAANSAHEGFLRTGGLRIVPPADRTEINVGDPVAPIMAASAKAKGETE